MSFDSAFAKTLKVEGVLSLDADDPGNWTGGAPGRGELKGTKYGISARQYPGENIAELTIERARELYRRDYWDVLRLDDILDTDLQEQLFDMAVNQGVPTAIRILQMAISAVEPERIKVDGVIGPLTIGAANAYSTGREKYRMVFWLAFRSFRFIRYYDLYMSNPSFRKYRFGWLSRINS